MCLLVFFGGVGLVGFLGTMSSNSGIAASFCDFF